MSEGRISITYLVNSDQFNQSIGQMKKNMQLCNQEIKNSAKEIDLYDAINKYIDFMQVKNREKAINEAKEPSSDIAIKLFEETTFKITDIDIKDDTAEATVEVTGKNYSRVLYRAQAIAVKNCPLYADDEAIDLYFTDATWESYKNEEEETRTGKLKFVKIEDTWCLDTETSSDLIYLFLGAEQ